MYNPFFLKVRKGWMVGEIAQIFEYDPVKVDASEGKVFSAASG